jgi:hypothetical protein
MFIAPNMNNDIFGTVGMLFVLVKDFGKIEQGNQSVPLKGGRQKQ